MMDQAGRNKSELRRQMRSLLAAMPDEERHDWSIKACDRLMSIEEFEHAGTVMLYMPLAAEVDVTPIALRCFQTAKSVCVPAVDWERRDMAAVEVTALDDRYMDTDEHGIRTPREGRPVVPTTIDLVVVPGLAFDSGGHRLGRGAGYYDRFLSRVRRSTVIAAIAFDVQIIDAVPRENHDILVDLIVTDRRITRTRTSRSRH